MARAVAADQGQKARRPVSGPGAPARTCGGRLMAGQRAGYRPRWRSALGPQRSRCPAPRPPLNWVSTSSAAATHGEPPRRRRSRKAGELGWHQIDRGIPEFSVTLGVGNAPAGRDGSRPFLGRAGFSADDSRAAWCTLARAPTRKEARAWAGIPDHTTHRRPAHRGVGTDARRMRGRSAARPGQQLLSPTGRQHSTASSDS